MLTIRNPHRAGRACSRVPDELMLELSTLLHERATWTRDALTAAMGNSMGTFRFCRCYRQEVTPAHELISALVAVVDANAMATQAELALEDIGDPHADNGGN